MTCQSGSPLQVQASCKCLSPSQLLESPTRPSLFNSAPSSAVSGRGSTKCTSTSSSSLLLIQQSFHPLSLDPANVVQALCPIPNQATGPKVPDSMKGYLLLRVVLEGTLQDAKKAVLIAHKNLTTSQRLLELAIVQQLVVDLVCWLQADTSPWHALQGQVQLLAIPGEQSKSGIAGVEVTRIGPSHQAHAFL